MSNNRPMSLRFTVTFVLSIVCLAASACANYKAGLGAYERGDYATALREWRPLAEHGDAGAQVALGVMYINGQGVPQDYPKAVVLFRLAADQGNAGAQVKLGAMYEEGKGVPQDLVLAHKWYNLASASGDTVSIQLRDNLAKQMTPTQIVEAQELAREWKPTLK